MSKRKWAEEERAMFRAGRLAGKEKLAEIVHKAYCKEYERQKGEPYWTKGDYNLLDEDTKAFARVTVGAIAEAIYMDSAGDIDIYDQAAKRCDEYRKLFQEREADRQSPRGS